MKKVLLLAAVVCTLIFIGCKKESESLISPPISDYAPLKVGKYITYQLDSLVFVNYGASQAVVSYQVKFEVSAMILDNLGRPAFSIIRYIRKKTSDPWLPDNTFMALNTGKALEYIENNMRFIKLQLPFNNGFSWKGNSYIDTYSQNSEVGYLNNWDYTYDSLNVPLSFGALKFDSTLKVDQRDEIINRPDNPAVYSEKNYSTENYAKGIGLVYRRFLHQVYQPATGGNAATTQGYGITLTITGYN